jgi:SAM-dependent methyltransferase
MTKVRWAVDSAAWDERYERATLLWSAAPNRWVVERTEQLAPGRGLDLAAGEGRHAVWLAERGWHVQAVDFSAVAVARAQELAGHRLGTDSARVSALVADVTSWAPPPSSFDLVVIAYLHLPTSTLTEVWRRCAAGLAPGGRLLIVGHDLANLSGGYGGPQDVTVLYRPADVVAALEGTGLDILDASTLRRPVTDDDGVEHIALDVLVEARRPTLPASGGDAHA